MVYNIEVLSKFFEIDLKIKKLLMELAPNSYDNSSPNAKMKYIDKVVDYTKAFKRYFTIISDTMALIDKKYIKKFFLNIENEIYKFDYRYDNVNDIYKNLFADMSPALVNEINETNVGYTLFNGISTKNCRTINELLHALHSFVINNDYIYNMIPPIKTNGDIKLRGYNSFLAEQLFDSLPNNTEASYIDILGLSPTHFIVMFRDLGHATTIEVTEENDKVFVSYFIPKLCNVEMIKKLKGINKIKNSDNDGVIGWATGDYIVTKEEFLRETMNLIQMIPTDEDIEAYKKYYR